MKNIIKDNFVIGRTCQVLIHNVHFFQPFESLPEGASRAASLITAPLFLSGYSIGMFLRGSKYLFYFLEKLISDKQSAETYKNVLKRSFKFSGVFFLLALVSLVANIVDIIGAAVNTLIDIIKKPMEEPSYSRN